MMDANWPFSEREHASSAISALGQKLDEARAERDRLARELEQTREVIACAQQTIEMHMRARQHYEAQLARMQPVLEAMEAWRRDPRRELAGRILKAHDLYLSGKNISRG